MFWYLNPPSQISRVGLAVVAVPKSLFALAGDYHTTAPPRHGSGSIKSDFECIFECRAEGKNNTIWKLNVYVGFTSYIFKKTLFIKNIDLHMPKQKRWKSVANGSDRWRRRKWCAREIWTLIIMLTLLFFFPDPLHRILHVTLRGREGWRHAPDCAPQFPNPFLPT